MKTTARARKTPATAKKKAPATKPPTATRKPAAAKPIAKRPVAKKAVSLGQPAARPGPGPRADLGAPIDSFFAKRSGPLREILDELRAMIDAQLPDASSSIKWGMPFYTLCGTPVCALAAFKAHVNLILAGPEGTFADPEGLLEGDGKTGRHLKLRAPADIPRPAVRRWLEAAATRARSTT